MWLIVESGTLSPSPSGPSEPSSEKKAISSAAEAISRKVESGSRRTSLPIGASAAPTPSTGERRFLLEVRRGLDIDQRALGDEMLDLLHSAAAAM